MRRGFPFLFVILVGLSLLTPERALAERVSTFNLGLEGGYRLDHLDWNIAGNLAGTSPNVLSELAWDDLEILQVNTGASLIVGRPGRATAFFARANLGVGTILDGSNQDSDYAGDNRTLEFSRSNNDGGEGEVVDFSIATGPRLSFRNGAFAITPLFGYSYNGQYLTVKHGNQTLSDSAIASAFIGGTVPPLGPFPGLDSSYDAHWWGPWIGADVTLSPSSSWKITGSGEYHWGEYLGEANWNLRSDFAHPVSFDHQADAAGVVVALGAEWLLARNLSVTGRFSYQNYQTDSGLDRVYFSSGDIASTRLNEVNWESATLMLGLLRTF